MANLMYQLLFAVLIASTTFGAPAVEEDTKTSVPDVQDIIDSAKPEDNDITAPISEIPVEITSSDKTIESAAVESSNIDTAIPESSNKSPDTVTDGPALTLKKEEISVPVSSSKDDESSVKNIPTSDAEPSTAVVSNVEVTITPEKDGNSEPETKLEIPSGPIVDYIDYDYHHDEIVPEAIYRPEQFPEGGFIPSLPELDYEYSDMDYPVDYFMGHSPQNDFYPNPMVEDSVPFSERHAMEDVIPPESYVEDPSAMTSIDLNSGPIVAGTEELHQTGPAYGIFANFPTPAPPIAEFPAEEGMEDDTQTVDLPSDILGNEPLPIEHGADEEFIDHPLHNFDDAFFTNEEPMISELDAVAEQNLDPVRDIDFIPPREDDQPPNFDSESNIDVLIDSYQPDETLASSLDSSLPIVAGASRNTLPESMMQNDPTIDQQVEIIPDEEPIIPKGVLRIFSAIAAIPPRIRGDTPSMYNDEFSQSDFLPFEDNMNAPVAVEDQFPFSDDANTESNLFEKPIPDVQINLDFNNQIAYVDGEPHSIRRPSSLIVLIDDIIQSAKQQSRPNNLHDKGLYDYPATFDARPEPSFYDRFHYEGEAPPFFDMPPFFRQPYHMRFNPLKSFVHGMQRRFDRENINRMRSMDAFGFGEPDQPFFMRNPYY